MHMRMMPACTSLVAKELTMVAKYKLCTVHAIFFVFSSAGFKSFCCKLLGQQMQIEESIIEK